jgi:glycosyltransferase involved in cell wall biosynthesis
MFVHRQVQRLVAAGVECHVLVFRPAVRGLPEPLTAATWLRYHPRWVGWPKVLDGVPVSVVFHRSDWRRGADLVAHAVDALTRHVAARLPAADFDVVFAHWLWPGGAVAMRLAARLGCAAAAIARGSEMHGWLEARPHCRRHVAEVLERVPLLLANCDGLRRRAAGLVPGSEHRMEVVYNGCDIDDFRPTNDAVAARRRLGFSGQRRIALFCGRVQRSKGIYELANAWERSAATLRDWQLVVLGAVMERDALRRLEEAGRRTGGSVRTLGPVAPERVAEYMRAADALVHPTHAEGLSNATVEAMASGIPVISSAVDGQPELVEDGTSGWLIPAHDVGALARALHEMASAPEELVRRGSNARQRAITRFDASVHAQHLATLLRAVAAAPGVPTHAVAGRDASTSALGVPNARR